MIRTVGSNRRLDVGVPAEAVARHAIHRAAVSNTRTSPRVIVAVVSTPTRLQFAISRADTDFGERLSEHAESVIGVYNRNTPSQWIEDDINEWHKTQRRAA